MPGRVARTGGSCPVTAGLDATTRARDFPSARRPGHRKGALLLDPDRLQRLIRAYRLLAWTPLAALLAAYAQARWLLPRDLGGAATALVLFALCALWSLVVAVWGIVLRRRARGGPSVAWLGLALVPAAAFVALLVVAQLG
ncbi:MAG: hypothetical protein ACRELC_10335 [Gemmatimonadota bacterium]